MLSEEQKAIMEQTDGRMIVVACPGSGKTTTMLERIHHMIADKGIDPNEILMVTFTKAAAMEMQLRFEHKYPADGKVCFATIHSICFGILRQEFHMTGNNILKGWQQMKHMKEKLVDCVDKQDLEDAATYVLGLISSARNAGLDPYKTYQDVPFGGRSFAFAPIYKSYERMKAAENKIDFDDMLILCLRLLKSNAEALRKYQNMFHYIIIDEYQDTNKVQANIFYLLSKEHGNLCIVGDDDQSIYGFRAADSSIMLSFRKKFPDAKRYDLSTNYRSGSKIIKYADYLIKKNDVRFKKKFRAGQEFEGELYLGDYKDISKEDDAICKWITQNQQNGIAYKDMAVLYRTNKEAISLLPLLKKKEIPISIKENPGDIHSHFVFDAVASYYHLAKDFDGERITADGREYFRKIINCPNRFLKIETFKNCDLSKESIRECTNRYFKTVDYNPWQSGRMKEALEDLKIMLNRLKGKSPMEFMQILMKKEFEEWVHDSAEYRKMSISNAECIMEDIKAEGSSFQTMEEWMDYVGEYKEFLETCGNNPEGVRFSTFHGSKGLEWEHVWIRNVTDGNVPFYKTVEENGKSGIEEERRMFYVALTRAKRDVNLSYLESPSCFLTQDMLPEIEIPNQNKQYSFSELEQQKEKE